MYLLIITSKYCSQITNDSFGNKELNGETQNIASNPINNVRIILHLYNVQGNIVGVTQISIPSNLGIGQTTLFNLQENLPSLTGTPKFYRDSFDFLRRNFFKLFLNWHV